VSRGIYRQPKLWLQGTGGEHRVTWMELFFDLIFVAAIAQVSSPLSTDYSMPQLLRYALMFVLIWSAWCGHTFYCTRFDTDDLIQRIATVVQCFIAAVMAANAKDALDSRSSAGFGAAYAGLRIVLVLQYLRVRRIPATRKLANRYAAGYSIAAAIWIASALTPAPVRFWLWAAGLLLDFATPFFAMHEARRTPPHGGHLPERFGLFVVIVLGEFVAAVMRGIESQEYWSVTAAGTAIASMAFGFVLAAWYFEGAQAANERHVRSTADEVKFQIWSYAHLPLCLAIGAAGVGFEHAIALSMDERWTGADAAVLAMLVAIAMTALITLGAVSIPWPSKSARRRMLSAQTLAMLATGAIVIVAERAKPAMVVALTLLLAIGQMRLATYGRVKAAE